VRYVALGVIEPPNYVVGHLRKFEEGEGHKGSSIEKTQGHDGFVERYIQGHVNIALRRTQRAKGDYSLILESGPTRPAGKAGCGGIPFNAYASRRYVHTNQSLMLSDDIELMESEEFVIPSRVRLQRFDDSSFALSEPLFAFASMYSMDGIHEVIGVVPDWKVRVSGWRFAIAPGEGSAQQIEAAANAVEHNPDFCIDNWREGFHICKDENNSFSIGAKLFNDSIWFTCPEGLDSFLQRWQLGLGPIDSGISVD
jgi:hypothetical protein